MEVDSDMYCQKGHKTTLNYHKRVCIMSYFSGLLKSFVWGTDPNLICLHRSHDRIQLKKSWRDVSVSLSSTTSLFVFHRRTKIIWVWTQGWANDDKMLTFVWHTAIKTHPLPIATVSENQFHKQRLFAFSNGSSFLSCHCVSWFVLSLHTELQMFPLSVTSFFCSVNSPVVVCFWFLSAVQDFNEGLAELDVEGGVDDWVDGAVEVTQPCDSAVERRRDAAAAAVSFQHVRQEERKPAYYEDTCRKHKHQGKMKNNWKLLQQLRGIRKTEIIFFLFVKHAPRKIIF